jgi:hypothetical protein
MAFVWDIASEMTTREGENMSGVEKMGSAYNKKIAAELAPRTILLLFSVGLVASLICAVMLKLFWAHQGLPDHPTFGALAQSARPEGLELFVSLALPAVVLLPSLVMVVMVALIPLEERARTLPAVRVALRQDAASYLLLPVMLLVPVLWRELGNGLLAVGLIFMATLSFKTTILLRLLWKAHLHSNQEKRAPLSGRAQAALFLSVWVIAGLAAVWINQAVSATSEEVGWLLEAEAMMRGPGFTSSSQDQLQSARAYFWPEVDETPLPQISKDAFFAFLISPLIAAGGRLGVLIAFAAILALIACQLLLWLEEAGIQRGPAAAATGLLALSTPVWVASQQVLPDVPAMLLVVIGLRFLTKLGDKPWLSGLGLVATAGLLGWIKLRFIALACGLAACGGIDLLWRRWGGRKAFTISLFLVCLAGVAIWLLPKDWWPRAIVFSWGDALAGMRDAPSLWGASLYALAGVFLDQNYGILIAAPVFILALAGIPAALVRKPRASWLALAPAFFYLVVICLVRWHLWYGGQAAPGRLIVVILPTLALPLAVALSGLRQPWWRLWVLVPAVLSIAYTWVITLVPAWRFSLPTGVNPLAASLEEALGLFLRQMLPSLMTPTLVLGPWLIGLAALFLLLAVPVYRHTREGGAKPVHHWYEREKLAVALICGALVLGGLAWGSLARLTSIEVESMRAEKARLWADGAGPGIRRGRNLANGGGIRGKLYFPPGVDAIFLEGWANRQGRVELYLDGRLFEQPWPEDQEGSVIALGKVKKGVHKIYLKWASCTEPECYLELDRIIVRQANP